MKNKVVLWGENAVNEKILLALELRAEANTVDIYTVPEAAVSEDFNRKMMDEWRNDKSVDFPDGTEKIERPLSVTDGILPDDIKTERTDLINRAQTEWHFIVLSHKLTKAYQNELEELKELVDKADSFQKDTWDRLKEFWGKVSDQVRERNLFKGHADELRDSTNKLFEEMKIMRKKLDEEFRGKSSEAMGTFMAQIETVEAKAKEGNRLRPLFDELVELQRKYRETKDMTRDHRNKVWAKLDGAFKDVKGKLFGDQAGKDKKAGGNNASDRTQRRLDGLLNAIQKMERSMRRDQEDLEFQNRRIRNSDGQLETQIRQAKLKMIEERYNSKAEKLKDMHKTKGELEERIAKEKAREEKRAAQAAKDAERKAREAEAKAKIAEEMKAQQQAIDVDEEKLKAAAAAIQTAKKPEGTVEVPTPAEVAAAAPVVAAPAAEEKAEAEQPKQEKAAPEATADKGISTLVDNGAKTAAAGVVATAAVLPKDETPATPETGILEEMGEMLTEAAEDVSDTVRAIASVVSDKVSEAAEEIRKYAGEEE